MDRYTLPSVKNNIKSTKFEFIVDGVKNPNIDFSKILFSKDKEYAKKHGKCKIGGTLASCGKLEKKLKAKIKNFKAIYPMIAAARASYIESSPLSSKVNQCAKDILRSQCKNIDGKLFRDGLIKKIPNNNEEAGLDNLSNNLNKAITKYGWNYFKRNGNDKDVSTQFRDLNDPEIVTSSIMDYPFFEDILKINDIGIRDRALIRYGYLENGGEQSLNNLKKYPICTDRETAYNPTCSHFGRGGMTPKELLKWYADSISSNSPELLGIYSQLITLAFKVMFVSSKDIDYRRGVLNYTADMIFSKKLNLPQGTQ